MPNEEKKVVQEGGPDKGETKTIVDYKPDYHTSLKKVGGNVPVTYIDDPTSDKRYKVYGSRKEVAEAKKKIFSKTDPKTQGDKSYSKLKYK